MLPDHCTDMHLGRIQNQTYGALLILDRGNIEVYEPNSKKGVHHRNFFISRCSQKASPIIILNPRPKKRLCP